MADGGLERIERPCGLKLPGIEKTVPVPPESDLLARLYAQRLAAAISERDERTLTLRALDRAFGSLF